MLSDDLEPAPGSKGLWPGIRRAEDGANSELMLGGRYYRTVDERTFDPTRRLRDMDAWGVSRQVLSPPPYAVAFTGPQGEFAELARQQNDFLGRVVAQHPDRFSMFGMLPYGDTELVRAEIERLEQLPGMVGICLTAHRDDSLCVPEHADHWQPIASNGWLVFVHPADTAMCDCDAGSGATFGAGMPTSTGRTAARILCSGLLAEVPTLRFLLAHAGGTLPALLDRIDHGWRLGMHKGLAELPSWYARRAFWVDSVVYGNALLRLAGDIMGADRVVYGSDYPFAAMVEPLALGSSSDEDVQSTWRDNGDALMRLLAQRG